ncbi:MULTISPECIES: NAD(P)/FAD-dependent oxidoreductase [Streptomyces]|uniref:Flavin-dependent dehydrogenase n=1 Tax=Streptomyces clavifer TaxID=68188 RepID=A0ABS4V184_9ACTN|nr:MULTISPECIES: NAD(P)/FAD-dependent oxidoreductase [Streptomyces]MBP2357664.1 flavin-dependent dehydrogenase [Streptomyces clavifer]MDX2747726.1 NAD(P)/FAD-dependent oxidoreductase [Streptomyces sp. NRRL_B-2557]MDX3062200.1 NAD(P)/FAD-dependent oxidoreductase [Streptomyces sp. ND04-05B]WRY85522.1 FAD-dependent oxidoreductase [Streptomyces clavifer]WUC31227.1 FAD-dependent oxidoreductase [Streptomyces clavifer]
MSSSIFGISAEYDVIVIGGGPAGATTAGLLAKRGHRVLVLDRERFPRYHVGESLIPAFMRPMEEMGLTERMDERGFERKYGGSLVWGNNQVPWKFGFLKGKYPYAFHTRRADLDAMILDRARELGAHIIEDATVKEPIEENGRVVGVRYALRGMDGVREVRAGLVVDASGQARVLSRRFTDVKWHEELRNVAVWTYYDNCERLEGDEYTNILIEGLDEGWFWAIPIDKGTISVGYVTRSATAGEGGQSLEDLFHSEVGRTTKLKHMLRNGRQSAGFRTARDWSYHSDRFYGDGWVLVGDSAAFVDPLFSTGVALASLAGSTLAQIVDQIIKHPEIETKALDRYATAYSGFFDEIREFVERFYDRTKYKEFYHSLAQEMIDPEHERKPADDFVTLISGLSGNHPMFHIGLDDLIADVSQPEITKS